MREELNAIMAQNDMGLEPLDDNGISATVVPAGMVFVYADEANQVVRLYTHVVPWTHYYKTNPSLLYALLMRSGPNLNYPDLHVGVDINEHFLWMTMVLSAAELEKFPEAYERFAQKAPQLKDELLALITKEQERFEAAASSEVLAPSSVLAPQQAMDMPRASNSMSEPSVTSQALSSGSAPAVDDVLSFFANPNMISV